MTETIDGVCPICGTTADQKQQNKAFWPGPQFDCPRCGQFVLCGQMPNVIHGEWFTSQRRSVFSHRLRCQQRSNGHPINIFDFELADWRLDDPLPSPAEQADRLILWIGDRQSAPAQYVKIPVSEVCAWIGAAITPQKDYLSSGLAWLLGQEEVKRLLEGAGQGEREFLRLTMAGWQRYESIKHGQVESRTAFMAMKFGDEDLNHAVENYFKPAVSLAGFELRLLTDKQRAGLIDDQLRVALWTSRLVIADLSHGNNGAYWEAGFAEGLSRPVIYTCRKKEWDERNDPDPNKIKVHFDTNHLATIVWDPENLQDAATRQTAMIQATLPGEAKMTD